MHPLAAALTVPVFAHDLAAASVSHWDLEPLVVLPLVVSALLYTLGLFRVWRKAGLGRGRPRPSPRAGS